MKNKFLDLGMQPIANNFLTDYSQVYNEYKYRLVVTFDEETKLVSLGEFVPPEMMFNESYVYHSSMSQTMRTHFSEAATDFKKEFNLKKVLEIGSNDGVFLRHFSPSVACAVEPCSNFAQMTNEMGFHTAPSFWNKKTAAQIVLERGKQDLIFSANCMCHVQELDEAFAAIKNTLSSQGVLVFEDPSLLQMIERGSYDQIYDEHAHIFSVTALRNLLDKESLEIFRVEKLSVHGGSNRIFVSHKGTREVEGSVASHLEEEHTAGLGELSAYKRFAAQVEQSKEQLVGLLRELKRTGNKIVSYGATSKSTTVFNYCGITSELIDYIVDTTPSKQEKLSPGVHIPVISPEEGFIETVDYAFLGAWNFEKEIVDKEKEFFKRGRFISHVPYVRIVGDENE